MSTLIRRRAISRRTLAGIVILLAATFGITSAGSAGAGVVNDRHASGGTHSAMTKPTIVFVHGGWADSSGWNAEIAELSSQGYPVIAPANPLRGLSEDAAYLRSVLETIEGPMVLVGHSYGGAVISNAAVGVENVKALVFVAGFAPDSGESLAQLVNKNPGTHITPDALIERPYPTADGGTSVDLYIRDSVFRTAFAGDLSSGATRVMQATQRPFSVDAFIEPSGPPAWKTLPSWYLVATNDNAIPPATQEFMAARAGSTVRRVKASHVAMMSQPKATTQLVLEAARSNR